MNQKITCCFTYNVYDVKISMSFQSCVHFIIYKFSITDPQSLKGSHRLIAQLDPQSLKGSHCSIAQSEPKSKKGKSSIQFTKSLN